MRGPVLVFISFLILSIHCAAESDHSCEHLQNVEDVLQCAEQRSNSVRQADAELSTTKAGLVTASQLRNPELSVNSVSGGGGAEARSETDVALGFPIELGGRRSARRESAQARVDRSETNLDRSRALARYETLLGLHRYRQLLEEQALVEEAEAAFSKLVAQSESRPRLSPEQEASLAVFKLAKGDYGLRRAEVRQAISQVASLFRGNLGVELESLRALLPAAPRTWPELSPSGENVASPQVRLATIDLRLAESETAASSAEAWPVLTLGPSAKVLREAGEDRKLYGFNIALSLPVLSLNQGAKRQAFAGESAARIAVETASRSADARRRELADVYAVSVSALKESLSSRELEKKHHHLETLFLKGLVPSSIIIESHRSLVDYTRARNERELKTLDAYLEYSLEQGRMKEVTP